MSPDQPISETSARGQAAPPARPGMEDAVEPDAAASARIAVSFAPLAPAAVSANAAAHRRFAAGFGRRFLLLWLAGLAWVVPAFWNRTFVYGLVVWEAVLIAGWLMDLFRLPRPSQLTVERSWPAALYLSVPNQVRITVRAESARRVWCAVVDEAPPALRDVPPTLALEVSARSRETAQYAIMPRERGDLKMGRVFLRYGGVLQLAERWAAAGLVQTVRVYPNIQQAGARTIYLTRSRQIELEKRLLRQRGQGREFESLREYREGDEFRDICWTATARRGKLVTKLRQVERSQAVWLVIDSGRLMRARALGLSKLDYAVDAALCLAHLALYSGDRLGLLAYGRRITHRLAPARGPSHLRQIVDQLATVRAEVAEADHLRAASTLLSLQKQRALIIWLTDLAETAMTPEVVEAGSQVAVRHLLVFMAMGQPDLNAAAAVRPGSGEEMYRSVAAQEMVYRRELLLGRLRERGALAMESAPRKLATAVLNQYLFVKERSLL